MTSKEFVIWLKGFVQAAHSYNITPKQWEDLKEQLEKVDIISNSITVTNTQNSSVTYGRSCDAITYTNTN